MSLLVHIYFLFKFIKISICSYAQSFEWTNIKICNYLESPIEFENLQIISIVMLHICIKSIMIYIKRAK